jgi:arylsulfatase A-like enzyme
MKKTVLACSILLLGNEVSAKRNVILIIADDLGTDYCGFYENHKDTVAMPNIRSLLSRGVRFTNGWSNPLSSPTRAGILTGRYCFRTGVGNAVGTGSAVLDTAEMTIPKMLHQLSSNGITTANIGKWHLQQQAPKSNYKFPNKMGFNHFAGGFGGELSDYYNWTKVTNGLSSTCTNYATTEAANDAIAWITAQGSNPYFLWLAFNAPHSPYHLPPAGLYSDTSLSGTVADVAANPKSYFKADVEAMDHEIGRVFDLLKTNNQWENTDIIFIGDNGDDPLVAQSTRAKGSLYQGGVNVPIIVAGPSVVNQGRTSDALMNTPDLFATILELFDYTNWQAEIASNKPVDSKSLIPIISNQSTSVHSWVMTEVFKIPTIASDGKSIRNTDYKLIKFDNGKSELYNLKNDPNEAIDLLKSTLSTVDQKEYDVLSTELTSLLNTNTGFFSSKSDDKNLLHQNYPNPFRTNTRIKYNVPSSMPVSLKIIDNAGKEIAKLVDQTQQSGEYNYTFDASRFGVASGTYYCWLTVGNFSQTMKMIYVK